MINYVYVYIHTLIICEVFRPTTSHDTNAQNAQNAMHRTQTFHRAHLGCPKIQRPRRGFFLRAALQSPQQVL